MLTQDEVFDRVARNGCLGALEGFNSTVFAYGQARPDNALSLLLSDCVPPALRLGPPSRQIHAPA